MIPLFLVLFLFPLKRLSALFLQEEGLSWGWILLLLLLVALLLLWWLLGPGARGRRQQMGDLPGAKKGSNPAPRGEWQSAAASPQPIPPKPALSTAFAPPDTPLEAELDPALDDALTADGTSPAPAQLSASLPAHTPAPATEPDNLRRIDGIGPKVAGILQANGIATFAQLADAPVERLQEILTAEGLKFMKPDTWPEQAGLAAKGDWEGLEQLQNQLRGGRRIDG